VPLDQPRRSDTVAQPVKPPHQALVDLAGACTDFHMGTRYVEYRGRVELRIWGTGVRGAALQVGVGLAGAALCFTRQGRPIARCDNLPEAVQAVRSRLRRAGAR
jgi:hypothetical protein